uniref:Uncharacterized protein n=1 Tax=Arundo donax TaxID=35708 RepID=A0A0A9EBB2_ARUDO
MRAALGGGGDQEGSGEGFKRHRVGAQQRPRHGRQEVRPRRERALGGGLRHHRRMATNDAFGRYLPPLPPSAPWPLPSRRRERRLASRFPLMQMR